MEVKDLKIFQAVVVVPDGTRQKFEAAGLSAVEARYVRATEIYHKYILELSQKQRQELATFIFRKCIVIYLLADSFEEAFRLFEIVNDRGKQLRRIDILKSINISPSHISQETVRNRIAQQWEEMENDVGEDVFESVFYLTRLILLKDKPQGDLLKEFQNRIFPRGLAQPGESFSKIIFENVKFYREIFIDKMYIDSNEKYGIQYQSLIHIMDLEFQASEWRACLIFFATKFGRDHFYNFCLAIEKLFLTQWVKNVRKDERYADYTKILTDIQNEKDPSKVISAIPRDNDAIIKAVTQEKLYHSGFAKYALLRLELVTSEHDVPKRYSARSIEHVFPQNPAEDS